MTFSNPTNLRIGATGILFGKEYKITGRVVMSGMNFGDAYYWNEYLLKSDGGDEVTLVYEVGSYGGEWRMVTMFEPEAAMSAKAATEVRKGDPINLDGEDLQVTLVAKSRVSFIEGKGPDWLKVGARANYFNAKSGDKLIVVSWTGEEVEYYRGRNLPQEIVESGFNIRTPLFSDFAFAGRSGMSSSDALSTRLALAIVLGICGFVIFAAWTPKRHPAFTKISAPSLPLTAGSTGKLKGVHYRINSDDLVEMHTVGLRFERHEYRLQDDAENPAILIVKIAPNAKEWGFFTPLHPAASMTPQQAAAMRVGDTVNVDGLIAKVDELFLSNVSSGSNSNSRMFGFSANTGNIHFLVRWNESSIVFYKGDFLTDKEVRSDFFW